ncbi:MAG: hypothetical protein HUU28_15065 [Planctomycetaceae bacterium]|nr:hypothetical protein [Planctomycetaceae bacterium]
MNRSRRGATRVSVTWLILFLVMTIVAAVMAWLGYDDAERYRVMAENARKDKDAMVQRESESVEARIRISELVGWSPAEAAAANTDLAQAKIAFDDWKRDFPDMGADIKTIEAALPKAKAAYVAQQRSIATLNDTVRTLQGEKDSVERGLRDALRQKDTELSSLQRQIADEQNTASQRQTELESRVASLNAQRNELDAQLREARNQIEANNRKFEDERVAAQTRLKSLSSALKFQKEPEAADGAVLSVSKDLALGWIDIGSNQRLARGTRFRVVSGKVGSTKLKGWAEVTEVKANMAEVTFSGIVDRFDPIVQGDIVYNPVYDPKSERTAVLCGRFSGQFNETELKVLLANMGITVQPGLANDTDYLIVGSELYVDEEGQTLENPLPPNELPVYKDAEAQGTQIVSIKDLRAYFKF